MKNWLKKLAVLLLFVALPLQGAAATLTALACSSSDEHQTARSHAHQDGASHQHDEEAASDHTQHFCGHLLASSPPAATIKMVFPGLPVFESSICLLATLFIPERPQRPPRT